jgi:hypothetical protein
LGAGEEQNDKKSLKDFFLVEKKNDSGHLLLSYSHLNIYKIVVFFGLIIDSSSLPSLLHGHSIRSIISWLLIPLPFSYTN